MTIEKSTYIKIRDTIYQKLGLHFEEQKIYFLEKRLEKRMVALGIHSFEDYAFHLKYNDLKDIEMQALANLITTNETYMFREFEQLQAFADFCLPDIIQKKLEKNNRSINIWSAGCSSGEEAYTLAIILREIIHDFDSWFIRIIATDVDEERLRMANAGEYEERSVKDVPDSYFDKYISIRGDRYIMKPEIKRMIEFNHLNLNDRMAMRKMRNIDFVLCRNVLIYFDDISRKAAVDNFYNSLNNGGYIFLGHSESIGRITNAFKLRRMGPHLIYYKE